MVSMSRLGRVDRISEPDRQHQEQQQRPLHVRVRFQPHQHLHLWQPQRGLARGQWGRRVAQTREEAFLGLVGTRSPAPPPRSTTLSPHPPSTVRWVNGSNGVYGQNGWSWGALVEWPCCRNVIFIMHGI